VSIPDTLPELLAQLRARAVEIKALIDRGEFASIYVPALQAKDLGLALEAHRNELRTGREKMLGPTLTRLVRYAYLLDAVGDLGNRDEIVAAYSLFTETVSEIETAFSNQLGDQ
jgi:hypothetical protein